MHIRRRHLQISAQQQNRCESFQSEPICHLPKQKIYNNGLSRQAVIQLIYREVKSQIMFQLIVIKLIFILNKRCELDMKPPLGCASNPCQNNGICTPLPKWIYKCVCRPGFTGERCESREACHSALCGQTGVCLNVGADNEMTHLCLCQNDEYIGYSCFDRNLEPNPCLHFDADNKYFAMRINPAIFVQCEGLKPHLKSCHSPLIFSTETNSCTWN